MLYFAYSATSTLIVVVDCANAKFLYISPCRVHSFPPLPMASLWRPAAGNTVWGRSEVKRRIRHHRKGRGEGRLPPRPARSGRAVKVRVVTFATQPRADHTPDPSTDSRRGARHWTFRPDGSRD